LDSQSLWYIPAPALEETPPAGRNKGRWMRPEFQRAVCASALLSALTGMLLCNVVSNTAGASTKAPVLRILVTNDDGVQAPGIDETVKVLKALPHTSVTVVAPLTNQSGTGARVTSGALTATTSTTASGYPAKAVAGYPADTIIWAVDDHGVAHRPNLVVSGINLGQNIGPLAMLSGTVGAAETAVARGIPALAVSQGIDNGQSPDFAQGGKYLAAWVQAHRHALLTVKGKAAGRINGNLNVPTCATGRIRGPATVRLATSLSGFSINTVNCSSSSGPRDEVAHPPL
jgi:5'-nucleotidase